MYLQVEEHEVEVLHDLRVVRVDTQAAEVVVRRSVVVVVDELQALVADAREGRSMKGQHGDTIPLLQYQLPDRNNRTRLQKHII
jgi:hypothetical protein